MSAVYLAYSALAYAAFLAASLWGVLFLADLGLTTQVDSNRSSAAWAAVLIDVGLWLAFALHHSVMARANVKKWLTRVVPEPLERSTYVLAASLLLGLLFWQWHALPAVVWQCHSRPWVLFIWVIYTVGWILAIASTFMTDHWGFLGLRQTGWLRQTPQSSASLSRQWLYGRVRHPMMLGLLVAFWATPSMTVGHLLFALVATGYIAVGVHFEERDLALQFGSAYEDYARGVPRFLPTLAPSTRVVAAQQDAIGDLDR